VSTRQHYLIVTSTAAALMILRVPWPMPPWRRGVLKAMTPVMQSHGGKQKDIHSLDGLVPYPDDRGPEDVALVARLESAYAGDRVPFAPFWLYTWNADDSSFRCVRTPSQAGP